MPDFDPKSEAIDRVVQLPSDSAPLPPSKIELTHSMHIIIKIVVGLYI